MNGSVNFHLQRIQPIITSYQLPDAAEMDPEGDYSLEYQFLSLSFRPEPAGTLRIRKSRPSGGLFDWEMECVRNGEGGYHFHYEAAFRCHTDRVASPESWECVTCLGQKPKTEAIKLTSLHTTGERRQGEFHIRTGKVLKRIPVKNGTIIAAKWPLFEAAQRWPEGADSFPFCLLDENDAVWPGQTATWQPEMQAPEPADRLYGLLQTGAGTLPRSFWRDSRGILRYVVSGTEVAVLSAVNQHRSSFASDYDISKTPLR